MDEDWHTVCDKGVGGAEWEELFHKYCGNRQGRQHSPRVALVIMHSQNKNETSLQQGNRRPNTQKGQSSPAYWLTPCMDRNT